MRFIYALAVGASLVSLAAGAVRAAPTVCLGTGAAPPEVYTLQAAPSNLDTEALFVTPDCLVESVFLMTRDGVENVLYLPGYGFHHIRSVPRLSALLVLSGNPITRGADLRAADQALRAELSHVPTDIRRLLLPSSLQSIYFDDRPHLELQSLDGLLLPAALKSFEIAASSVKTLKSVQFPASLESISISKSPIQAVDFQLPQGLKILSFNAITSSSFGKFEQLTLPSGLETFQVWGSGSASIRGIRWPSTLKKFDFRDTTITAFEIRQSDVALFKKLAGANAFRATVAQSACSSNAAKLENVGGANLCVVSDAAFDSVYGVAVTPAPTLANGDDGIQPTTTRPNPESQGGSNGGSDTDTSPNETAPRPSTGKVTRRPTAARGPQDESLLPEEFEDEEATEDLSETRSSSTRTNGSPTARSPKSASNSSSDAATDGSPTAPGLSSSATTSPEASPIANGAGDGPSHTSLTIIVLACALSCAVGGIAYRMLVKKTQSADQHTKLVDDSTGDSYTRADTPTTSFDTAESKASSAVVPPELEALRVAFMSDQDLVRNRIDQVEIGPAIAEGGSGIVHLGSYQGQTVAVKQLPPEAWGNSTLIASFLDEIRLCTRLDHPKIVAFVGVTWSGGRDLAAVSELMVGGDLKSVLQKYPSSTGSEWMSPWTEKQLRSKTLIALDVIEAVVYLHSFNSPIIHRDLKAKNVLLDTKGNAKLSDFGISREMSIDETMTSDVGTAAWIAPEVLRGERYSEKADIYSLGVLLVEMDRCAHPYANEAMLMASGNGERGQATTSGVAHKNTQIAVLVSTGQLRPSPSPQCPEQVTQVVATCLSYAANDRPTAMEVFYQLRQVRKCHDVAQPLS